MKLRRKGSPMLTTSEAAHILNVHINTVRRWTNKGILKGYRIGSRRDIRFREEDVVIFLTNQTNQSEKPG